MILIQAQHYLEECEELHSLLSGLTDEQWALPTQFKNWTSNDVLRHLYMFDYAADLTLNSREELQAFLEQIMQGRSGGKSLVDYTAEWMNGCEGSELLKRWYESAIALGEKYQSQDASRRVAWGGPDMSVRSCISARQMETWSHGQAIFDLMGKERRESDRLYNIVMMGINTFAWTFINRKLDVPESRPQVRLVSPDGNAWEFGDIDENNLISGSAVEFCQVVTQTRNIADTELQLTGQIATEWMSMAQCFAGPPHAAPEPGSRFRAGSK